MSKNVKGTLTGSRRDNSRSHGTPQHKGNAIQDRKGMWYEMRVRPYLTAEKKIDGVVLSFLDIDTLVRGKVGVEKS